MNVSHKHCSCRGGCSDKKCSCWQLIRPCLQWCQSTVESCYKEGVVSETDLVVNMHDGVEDVKSITIVTS